VILPRAARDGAGSSTCRPSSSSPSRPSLIPLPFEHDDANRALMGSNMQRQAVPLLRRPRRAVRRHRAWEYITARDSGAVVSARRAGSVDYVDSQRVVVRVHGEDGDTSKEMGADIYGRPSSSGRTRTPASTRSRSSASGRRWRRGRRLPTGRAPS